MTQKRNELHNLQEQMNGLVFDIEYSVDAVKHLGISNEHVDVNNSISNSKTKFRMILF